jgi:AAA domain
VSPLEFVDPTETDDTYRVVLWAAPGQGKSVAAASAPGPILVLTADRPSAYRFARKHHAGKEIQEVRYRDEQTLREIYQFIRDAERPIRTLVVDPVSHIVDQLVDTAPRADDGGPDYQAVNKKLLGFVKSFRGMDINVVLVAHEKLNDGKKGDGKLYPALGGPALINKVLAEMDIVAHVERHIGPGDGDDESVQWIGQLQPRGNLVCKESTGALGDRRIADLARWFEIASAALTPDEADQTEPTPIGAAAA